MVQGRWRSPHVHRGRFASYPGERTDHTFWRVLSAFLRLLVNRNRCSRQSLSQWIQDKGSILQNNRFSSFLPEGAHITWVGHSTFLIAIAGTTILTDPVFGDLFHILPFKRVTPPGISLDMLPRIDVVLVSHNHPDHMDKSSLLSLRELCDPLFVVPYGDKQWFHKYGFRRVEEFMWWDRYKISDLVHCTFLPAIHWSRRGLFDHNRSLWGGWMVEALHPKTSIYFAGDTAYGSHFRAIAEAYSAIDVALMPIGPAEPYDLMRCSHLNPEDAGRAFLDLGARSFVPMHWGTYSLGVEPLLEPVQRLQSWWQAHASRLYNKSLNCLKIGETGAFIPSALPPVEEIQSVLEQKEIPL